jgi:GT2 family glycosyltransferase
MTSSSANIPPIGLSVVIAASNNAASLDRCLASLVDQATPPDHEVIVISNYAESAGPLVEKKYPQIKYLNLPETTTVPELRSRGIAISRGEIVALAEDNVVFEKRWCSEIVKAHAKPYDVIGGAVENASFGRSLDWAVYFYEYGRYMLPGRCGVVDALAGNNVSYKRSVFKKVERMCSRGFFETFVHRELQAQGMPLYMCPSAVVYHQQSYRLREVVAQSYYHGRSFGGMRVSASPIKTRLALILASPMLPLFLPSRIALRVIRKRRNIGALLRSLPYLLLLVGGWSWGELSGYLWGEGDSSTHWT